MISSLVAGTNFGTVLIWAIVIGAFLKFTLTEGIGRWYMASGETILKGWHMLGRGATWYFLIYLFIVTFVFGAAVTSTAALGLDAMFPDVLPIWVWAALQGVAGFVIVGIGRYDLFERIMKVIAAVKFGAIILLAILLTPSLTELALGLVPRIPEGGFINAMAIIGGVGGTYTLASYTYWVRERGWRQTAWIPTMRTDAAVGYILTGLFMISMLVIGSEFLFGTGTNIEGEEGLLALTNPIQDRFGIVVRWVFLIGFWAVATGAMIGAWNGAAYLFADSMRTFRAVPDEQAGEYLSEKSVWFRAMLVWITFPPHDPLRLRPAGRPRDRLRLPRRPVPALPRHYAPAPPQLQPRRPRVPQPPRHEHPARHLRSPLYRGRRARGPRRPGRVAARLNKT